MEFDLIDNECSSILNYAKGSMNLRTQGSLDPMRGAVGSVLTPGTRLDGQNPENPDPEPENPEKPENPFPARFALLRPNRRRLNADQKNCPPVQMIHLRSVD